MLYVTVPFSGNRGCYAVDDYVPNRISVRKLTKSDIVTHLKRGTISGCFFNNGQLVYNPVNPNIHVKNLYLTRDCSLLDYIKSSYCRFVFDLTRFNGNLACEIKFIHPDYGSLSTIFSGINESGLITFYIPKFGVYSAIDICFIVKSPGTKFKTGVFKYFSSIGCSEQIMSYWAMVRAMGFSYHC